SDNFHRGQPVRLFILSTQGMTDLFSPFVAPTPSHPSRMNRLFRSSASGRDSPRTLVMAEEILNLHIGTPPVQQDELKSFIVEIPRGKAKTHLNGNENLSEVVRGSSSSPDPLFRLSPTRRRSLRQVIDLEPLSPLE